eukprot:PLAT13624.1.p1 GENE.PLAT13624.1~~PLAT13624.1.p1  ORF type:complete len:438 (-),score=156.40 PLAT13624.1:83-1396(-)
MAALTSPSMYVYRATRKLGSEVVAKEDPGDPAWRKHGKHFFVLSTAGKPIWARWGDEVELSGFMGMVQALMSLCADAGSGLKTLRAGRHKFVFMRVGPLVFLCVASTGEPFDVLRQQLRMLHEQIIFILTSKAMESFSDNPGFDLRNLLGGTEKVLEGVVHMSNYSAGPALEAVPVLQLPSSTRSRVGALVKSSAKDANALYAIVVAGDRLVTAVQPKAKEHQLHAKDMLMLINFLNTQSSLKAAESWTPVCMTGLRRTGFLYAFIAYLSSDVCLLLLGTKYTPEAARAFVNAKAAIADGMGDALGEMHQSLLEQPLSCDEFGVDGLLHFVYKPHNLWQFTSPLVTAAYDDHRSQKRLLRRFLLLQSRSRASPTPFRLVQERDSREVAFMLAGDECLLFAAFSPLISNAAVMKGVNRLLRLVSRAEESLFLLNIPTW